MAFYDEMKAVAEELIAEFGFDATLIKAGAKSGPANDPTFAADVETAIKAVQVRDRSRDMNGALIEKRTRKMFISTSAGVEPEKADQVRMPGGQTLEIEIAEPVAPGAIEVVYKVDLIIG